MFSETKEVLENIIQNHKNGTTFNKGATFQSVKNSLAEESNLLFISNSTSLKDILKQDFSKDFNKELNNSVKSEFSIAAQITTDKNFYHTNIIIEKNTKTIGNNGISELFKVKLDTASATRPQFVTNHLTKQKEVIVQDHKNVLHLISSFNDEHHSLICDNQIRFSIFKFSQHVIFRKVVNSFTNFRSSPD